MSDSRPRPPHAEVQSLREQLRRAREDMLAAAQAVTDEYTLRVVAEDGANYVRQENEAMRLALRRIASPLECLQADAQRNGRRLDAARAIALCESASFLRQIALDCLTAVSPDEADRQAALAGDPDEAAHLTEPACPNWCACIAEGNSPGEKCETCEEGGPECSST